jgi:hypothetical protein
MHQDTYRHILPSLAASQTLLVMPHSHLGPLDFSSALTIPAITQRLQEATSVFGSALRITLLERIDALIWTLFVK